MPASSRLQYLDWMRGLAVVLMIQTHASESFLRLDLRQSEWYWLSQYLGGMSAPMFLFLAGVSLALVMDRLRGKGTSTKVVAQTVLRRGGWILFLAYAFRFEQIAVWYPYSQWSGMCRVDILNCIAVSSLAAGFTILPARGRKQIASLMGIAAATIVIVTPWVFLVRGGLPSALLDYLNGGENSGYFVFFSWAAFTFAGAATAFLLIDARTRGEEEKYILRCGAFGVAAFAIGYWMNGYPFLHYGFYDYSRTSPQFFLVRLGYMFMFLYAAYRAPRWRSLLIFGQTSLLIYWAHIELVYGRLRPFRNTLGIAATAAQLLWIVPLMLVLAHARLHYSRRIRGREVAHSASE